MKKRTLHTTKILAVVLTSLTGCGEAPVTSATAEPGPAEAPAAAMGAAAAPTATPVTRAAPPDRPMSNDPRLLALARELHGRRGAEALAEAPRYRPLCDADGYPLVGNVAQGKGETGTQPSDLCAVVREQRIR